MIPAQLAMFPVVSFSPLPGGKEGLAQANDLIVRWGHDMGAIERPFGWESWVLTVDEEPVSVAVSVSTVSDTVAGYVCREVVELGRLCSRPGDEWANRVALRLWRQVAAPRWHYWPVKAAVSYSLNSRHDGQLYRFDGWEKVTDAAGAPSGPNATWSKKRQPGDPRAGEKTLWLWEYGRG
jgi:hypothetical protein